MTRNRGIARCGTYLPRWRLDRSNIAEVAGNGGGRGTRTVASYDQDAATLAVEAARVALAGGAPEPEVLWFTTTAPPWLDRATAPIIHGALRLDPGAGAYDAVGSLRSTMGALRSALEGRGTYLLAAGDLRVGLPGGPDESAGGDGGAAVVVVDDDAGPLLAEYLAGAAVSEEVGDRWRVPGESHSRLWEDRYGEVSYLPLGQRAWESALKGAGLAAEQVDRVAVCGLHQRACAGLVQRLGLGERAVDDLAGTVGTTGAAHPLLLLAGMLETARPGETLALLTLADGADAVVLRATDAVASWQSPRPLSAQLEAGTALSYGTYLRWRGLLAVEPPRRPEPARPSVSAAARSLDWKLGFVGSVDATGEVHLPPRPDDVETRPMSEVRGTVATFTVDRLAHSPSPPVVFAVVDFDGGGRLPVELTDVVLDEVHIGARVEMTFRRLFTADGLHNYFWKARPVGKVEG
jgi:3-hydroxy-3-methylglutaryl CoA synthase/uncharacterized OB-fold protein